VNPAPVAVVTGAGSGIGRAVVHALAGAGYALALFGRRVELLEAAAVEIGTERSLCVAADISDEGAVGAAFGKVVERWGRVDLLFNNAGAFGPTQPIGRYPLAAWEEVLAVNLTGAFLCAREAFRTMERQRPRGGRIINNGSLSAQVPRPNAVAYSVTKHGVTGLTRALSLEGRGRDIACSQIDIGNAATEMTDGFANGALQPDGSVRAEPTIDALHIARAVAYIAGLPLDATVPSMTIMATEMPFAGRG
jgi:NAD(P)-dependent dehydrogenase (short-subunit alcohol dehydrogenase family)